MRALAEPRRARLRQRLTQRGQRGSQEWALAESHRKSSKVRRVQQKSELHDRNDTPNLDHTPAEEVKSRCGWPSLEGSHGWR